MRWLLLGLVLLGGCDYGDNFAIRNGTSDPLSLSVDVEAGFFATEDCDSHMRRQSFQGSITVSIPRGTRLCIEGPTMGKPNELRDLLKRVRVTRRAAPCIDETGAALKARPAPKQGHDDTLVIDDALCP